MCIRITCELNSHFWALFRPSDSVGWLWVPGICIFKNKLPGNSDAHQSLKITALNVMFRRTRSYLEERVHITSYSCRLEEKFSLAGMHEGMSTWPAYSAQDNFFLF